MSNKWKGRPFKVGKYACPVVTVVHPEHGKFAFNLHAIASNAGVMTLVAIRTGMTLRQQCDLVFKLAADTSEGHTSTPVEISDREITPDLAINIAAHLWGGGEPKECVVIAGTVHKLSAAGRKPAKYPSTLVDPRRN